MRGVSSCASIRTLDKRSHGPAARRPSAEVYRFSDQLGRAHQSSEGHVALLEHRHPGHLGSLPRLQPVPRQRQGAGRLPAWLHAPMAKFVGNSNSSRGQAARETNNGPQRARIAETDASRTNCEPPVPRVRLVSLDRTRCLRSACTRCDPQVWVSEVFSNLGGAWASGVGRGDFQVSFSRAWLCRCRQEGASTPSIQSVTLYRVPNYLWRSGPRNSSFNRDLKSDKRWQCQKSNLSA